MVSDYIAKAITANDVDHGDSVYFDPDKQIVGAGVGYTGEVKEGLNNRFNFRADISSAWYNGSGAPDQNLGYEHDYYLDDDTGVYYRKNQGQWEAQGVLSGGGGGGDVVGPASSVNNTIARFDGTSGNVIDDSQITIDDNGNVANINTLVCDAIASPTHAEGTLFYDNANKTLTLYNDKPDVALQIGREMWLRALNNTGSTIVNGTVVYISGVSGSDATIALAQPDEYDKSRIIGVTTEQINDGQLGEVTVFGSVSDVDTSGLSTGPIYLDNDGILTSTKPSGSDFVILVGTCLSVNETTGRIFVNSSMSETTVEVTDTNGFPSRTNNTMSFDDGTRTFTITPTGTHFYYYQDGHSVVVDSADTVVIDDTEGLHVIYYDDAVGTLLSMANPTESQVDQLIRLKCLVAYVYWNATDSRLEGYFADERHGISMSPNTHSYLHFTRGAQYLSGLSVGDLNVAGDGDTNSHAQFSVTSGFITDEDNITSPPTITSTSGLSIYYLDGASGNMRKTTQSGFAVLTDVTAGVGVTGRLVWNEWTGATWQLSTVTNNDFVLCHVFAINGIEGEDQTIAVIGQAEYGNVAAARAGASTEIANILIGFPFEEVVPIASIIFQTGNTYGNDVQARVRPADDGDYVDWRTTELAQGVTASSHSNLTDLDNDDHTQYALVDGTRIPDTTYVIQTSPSETILTGNGVLYFTVPSSENGRVLKSAHAAVVVESNVDPIQLQIYNITQTVNMLSTIMEIDTGEFSTYTATTPPVVDTDNDDVSTGDRLRIDIQDDGNDAAEGLEIHLVFGDA